MMEMSVNQARAEHDERVGVAMRQVQDAKTLAEEFGKIADKLYAVEPTSPLAGNAQKQVLDFCRGQQTQWKQNAQHRQTVVDRLKVERP